MPIGEAEGAPQEPKPFEYRPPIETVCKCCGHKYIGFTCPLCRNEP